MICHTMNVTIWDITQFPLTRDNNISSYIMFSWIIYHVWSWPTKCCQTKQKNCSNTLIRRHIVTFIIKFCILYIIAICQFLFVIKPWKQFCPSTCTDFASVKKQLQDVERSWNNSALNTCGGFGQIGLASNVSFYAT